VNRSQGHAPKPCLLKHLARHGPTLCKIETSIFDAQMHRDICALDPMSLPALLDDYVLCAEALQNWGSLFKQRAKLNAE